MPKFVEINNLHSYLLDFVIGSLLRNRVYSVKQIPVKFRKSLRWVLVFLFKIFPKTKVLIQKTFFYSYFLQKFGLSLFGEEPSRTLNGAFYFSFPNTVKPGKLTSVHLQFLPIREYIQYSLKMLLCHKYKFSSKKVSQLT